MNTDNRPEKRGKWWVRLCIDLKHLRMKKESLKVAEHALLESTWVKTGSKSALFRIKENLAKFMAGQQNIKTKKNKNKGADIEEEEEEKGDRKIV